MYFGGGEGELPCKIRTGIITAEGQSSEECLLD